MNQGRGGGKGGTKGKKLKRKNILTVFIFKCWSFVPESNYITSPFCRAVVKIKRPFSSVLRSATLLFHSFCAHGLSNIGKLPTLERILTFWKHSRATR